MKTIFLVLSLLQLSLIAQSQQNIKARIDTTASVFEKRKLEVDHNYLALRLGVGVSSSFMMELGLSKGKMQGDDHGHGGAFSYYASAQYVPKSRRGDAIYGILTGLEFTNVSGAGSGGIEFNYQTNKKVQDFLMTPKLGFGLGNYIMLRYGYQIPFMNRPFANFGRHQVTLVFNIPMLDFEKGNVKFTFRKENSTKTKE